MMKCKFALVFMIVLAVYLQQSQGFHIAHKKVAKLPIVATKVGIAKSIGAKIKLAAFKKWAATKTIVKAPFVLGKKVALLKIGAVKSLAALKVAKAKKIFGFASKKVAPAIAVASALPAAAVAALKPIVVAAPAVSKPILIPAPSPVPETETETDTETEPTPVVDVYEIPVKETHYEVAHPNAHYNSHIVSTYKDESNIPQTYSHGYSVSLHPAGEVSSQYQYYSVPNGNHDSYKVIDLPDTSVVHQLRNEDTDTEVVVPHSSYGVPN